MRSGVLQCRNGHASQSPRLRSWCRGAIYKPVRYLRVRHGFYKRGITQSPYGILVKVHTYRLIEKKALLEQRNDYNVSFDKSHSYLSVRRGIYKFNLRIRECCA
jgi:hypothetical protein